MRITMFVTLFSLIIAVNAGAITTTNLVGYYSFNGHLNDLSPSPNVNNASAIGSPDMNIDGLFGLGVKVGDGSGTSYVSLGNPLDYQFGNSTSFTITYWVKMPDSQASDPTLIGNKDWSVSGGRQGFVQAIAADDVKSNIADGTTRKDTAWIDLDHDAYWDGQGKAADDPVRWTFVAMTVDRSSNVMTNYVMDGWVVNQWDDSSTPTTVDITGVGSLDSGYPINLGQDGDGSGYDNATYAELVASFDDLTVWRRSLTTSELWEIYTAGRAGQSFGDLVGISETAALLDVDTSDFVFPSQDPQSVAPVTLPLTLENIGSESLQFQAAIINDSLGEFSVSPTAPQTLTEGQSVSLDITWDPSSTPGGTHSAQLSITHDTVQTSPIIINLRGKIRQELFGGRRVLVVGIDGVRPDALQAANTPNMDALAANGAITYDAYAGGVLGTPTQQATSSGPGWSSILTGVWVDKHNVPNNSFSSPDYANYPHFFTLIKQGYPDALLASIVQWAPINTYITPNADTDIELTGSGASVASQAASLLASDNPDVLFLHFDDVDYAGHAYGYSPTSANYLAAIEGVDTHTGTVVTAIQNRANYTNEDWLIIVTTDHGGLGTSHGGQSTEERTIFVIASGNSICQQVISNGPGHTTVPPTAMRHLGIAIDPAWGWEDDPFGAIPPDGDIAGPSGRPDCIVDILDLRALAEQFLDDTLVNPSADFTGPTDTPDGIVNLNDFAWFAGHYLESSI